MKNGLFEENGELIYYKDDFPFHAGVVRCNDKIYYIGKDGRAVKGIHFIHSNMTNGILERGSYLFGDDCVFVRADDGKNGLFEEDGRLIYYKNGRPCHAGVIKEGGDIYYISSNGYAVKGMTNVHHEMTNGILKRGTYTFGDDYKLVPGSYIAPKKSKHHSKLAKFFMGFNWRLIVLVLGIVLVGGLLLAAKYMNSKATYEETSKTGERGNEVEMPTYDSPVSLCSDYAKSLYDGKITVKQALAGGSAYKPFTFVYNLVDTECTLMISESPDMKDADVYFLTVGSKSINIDNLKTGKTYYYRASVGEETFPGYFKTSESTRFVNLPGVKNTRDIGGYTTLNGKKVKQGLLIRGSEIDGLTASDCFLEKNSIQKIIDSFGFVTEIDLRSPDLFSDSYQTRFGKDILHKHYDHSMTGTVFSAEYQAAVREIFADLADENNYPMYIHCTDGADRTGIVCFLLEAVLGLPEEVMEMDYRLSGFYKSSYASSNAFNYIYGGIEGYTGNTVQEKIVSYLTSPEVGVTTDEIEAIRKIFLED